MNLNTYLENNNFKVYLKGLDGDNSHISYLSMFKGGNMLLTCFSILAIDFQVFIFISIIFLLLILIRFFLVNLEKQKHLD